MHAQSLQSCLTLCDPMGCSPSGSSVHGILQARILEWVAMPSSRESSQARDWIQVSYVSCIGRWVLYHKCHLGSPSRNTKRIKWICACPLASAWHLIGLQDASGSCGPGACEESSPDSQIFLWGGSGREVFHKQPADACWDSWDGHWCDKSIKVLFSRSVMSNFLWPHKLQHASFPCPSLSSRICSNSYPLNWYCYLTISSSVTPFSCPQSFPASGSFPVIRLFASGGQSTGASASVLPVQRWFDIDSKRSWG